MSEVKEAAIATVEWALRIDFCDACGMCFMRHEDGQTCMAHDEDCPIPALGAAVLRRVSWMKRRCTNCGDPMEVGDTEERCREVYKPPAFVMTNATSERGYVYMDSPNAWNSRHEILSRQQTGSKTAPEG